MDESKKFFNSENSSLKLLNNQTGHLYLTPVNLDLRNYTRQPRYLHFDGG